VGGNCKSKDIKTFCGIRVGGACYTDNGSPFFVKDRKTNKYYVAGIFNSQSPFLGVDYELDGCAGKISK